MEDETGSSNLLDYILHDNDPDKQPYKNRMKEINYLLTMNSFPEIGDLFDNSLFSINKTLNVLHILLEDRKQQQNYKTEKLQKCLKTENEFTSLVDKTENTKI